MAQWFPTVVLKHSTPDGGIHFDLMLAQDDPPRQGLLTWRLPSRPDLALSGQSMAALSLGEHRTAYLHYEGPLTGSRGSVVRVARGRYCWIEGASDGKKVATPGRMIQMQWGGGGLTQRWAINDADFRCLDSRPTTPESGL